MNRGIGAVVVLAVAVDHDQPVVAFAEREVDRHAHLRAQLARAALDEQRAQIESRRASRARASRPCCRRRRRRCRSDRPSDAMPRSCARTRSPSLITKTATQYRCRFGREDVPLVRGNARARRRPSWSMSLTTSIRRRRSSVLRAGARSSCALRGHSTRAGRAAGVTMPATYSPIVAIITAMTRKASAPCICSPLPPPIRAATTMTLKIASSTPTQQHEPQRMRGVIHDQRAREVHRFALRPHRRPHRCG